MGYVHGLPFEVLHFENLGRDFPGEWMSADLGVALSDGARARLRQEYKTKMDEDNVLAQKTETGYKIEYSQSRETLCWKRSTS